MTENGHSSTESFVRLVIISFPVSVTFPLLLTALIFLSDSFLVISKHANDFILFLIKNIKQLWNLNILFRSFNFSQIEFLKF